MLNLNVNDEKPSRCRGAVFRAEVRHFRTERGFGFSVRLNEVKRMSCPGCDSCGWQGESFAEVDADWPVHGIEAAEDKKLYTIGSCNEARDLETGHIDSWDLKLVEYSPDRSE